MDAELVVTPPGCAHLGSFKVDNWKQNLRAIYQCFVWSGSAEARKRKVRPPATRGGVCVCVCPSVRPSVSGRWGVGSPLSPPPPLVALAGVGWARADVRGAVSRAVAG